MNIWILNHYAVPLKYYYLARSYNFARQLVKQGHMVTIFCASTAHNSSVNLISDKSEYIELHEDGLTYVLFRGRVYNTSGVKRIVNHIEVAMRMVKYCPSMQKRYGKPDVIYASAGQTLTLWAGIKVAKKLSIKSVCEITDLWPESFIAYGLIGRNNPLLKLLYSGERWVYTKADELIFSMEGGRDYIIEKGWDKDHGGSVDLRKVRYINNGVDLEKFTHDRENYRIDDSDLDDDGTFKVIYTGSIRKVNHLETLIEVARKLQQKDSKVKILIYGDGDERKLLQEKAINYNLDNVLFKGKVDKRVIPYILSKGDLCLMHGQLTGIVRYGMSMNKSFDYMASGKPIISTYPGKYDYILDSGCGITITGTDVDEYADLLIRFEHMPRNEYQEFCKASSEAAEHFDFSHLTEMLIETLEA